MDYNEYRTHLLTCEYLGKEPAGQYKKLHDFLTGLWDGMAFRVNSQTNRIALQKGDKWLIYQDPENGYLWCHTHQVWSFFRNDMDMDRTRTQEFIKSVVEQHLQYTVGTPASKPFTTSIAVEQHLQCTVGTPTHG